MIRFFLLLLLLSALSGCAIDIPREVPGENEINRVSDIYPMKDGRHLLFLNSNLNRAFDYGRLSLYDLKENRVVSSLLVDSLAGKMAVSDDESTVYVSSRDHNVVQKFFLSREEKKSPALNYATGERDSSSVEVSLEPFALHLDPQREVLFVTHIRNGELTLLYNNPLVPQKSTDNERCVPRFGSCMHDGENVCSSCDSLGQDEICMELRTGESFASSACSEKTPCSNGFVCLDPSSDRVLGSYKLMDGITDIEYMEAIGAYAISHKSSGDITLLEMSPGGRELFSFNISQLQMEESESGRDIRSITVGEEGDTLYLSYMKRTSNGSLPNLTKVHIVKESGVWTVRKLWSVRLAGTLGEVVRMPYYEGSPSQVVLVASSTEQKIYAVDTLSATIFHEIDLVDITAASGNTISRCNPYALKVSTAGEGDRLFVSCFDQDAMLSVNVDFESDNLFEVEEVIR